MSLARLLWHVPVPAMLTLIASLLLERRVLVVGHSRDMVSAAVCAAQALLHPFRCACGAGCAACPVPSTRHPRQPHTHNTPLRVRLPADVMPACCRWHHIYLPLLPRSLSDYLTAPMPFLIGLPAQLLPALKQLPMDEVTLIDLDLGK